MESAHYTLKEQLSDSINKLSFIKGYIEDLYFPDFIELSEEEFLNLEIDENSHIYFENYDDDAVLSVNQFITMAQTKHHFTINDLQSYSKSDQEIYFLLDISDYNTSELLSNSFNGKLPQCILEKDISIEGNTYHIGLFNGYCMFHLLVEESGKYNEYCPAYSAYDYFIKVSCEQPKIDMQIADNLANAYAFELQNTFNIFLPFSTGRVDLNPIDRSAESLLGLENTLFPLIYGVGAAELLNIYNTAKNTLDLDFKILGYTKIIEYIAPTITQKELIEKVSLKLTSPNIFKPDAAFISELGAIYDKHRNTVTKDSELIRTAILTVVSLNEIWDILPNYLKGKQKNSPNESETNTYLEKIAETICSTRNEIAHAKANYETRGTECPTKQKENFCKMMDSIAVKCIRWYALQPEDKRVVLK